MSKRRILYVCHNHPSVRPGGAETYALELYEAMRSSKEFEPIFLAKGGPPISDAWRPHPGTLLSAVNGDPNQYFFYADGADFDWFYGTVRNKEVYTKFFHEFLAAYQPDLLHIQHTQFFGYDLIRQARNTLGPVPLVYTLHEYLPICHRQGQMIRTRDQQLCEASSPQRCHECFPELSPQAFFMRQRFIQSHLTLVDLFLAPSRFLLERYVEWGIPREKIRYEEYGRQVSNGADLPEQERPRTRFGFFGQINPFKGLNVLLKAMQILAEEDRRGSLGQALARPVDITAGQQGEERTYAGEAAAHLWVHGANLDLNPGSFQNEIKALVEATTNNVTLAGRYAHNDLPGLMNNIDWVVVPSIWWENSPLVIQEAFQHGRPVICSDIGGMAEKVTDGVNGLHFRVGNPASLAQTIRRAVNSPGLWDRLRQGIPKVHRMDEHMAVLSDIYWSLINLKKPCSY